MYVWMSLVIGFKLIHAQLNFRHGFHNRDSGESLDDAAHSARRYQHSRDRGTHKHNHCGSGLRARASHITLFFNRHLALFFSLYWNAVAVLKVLFFKSRLSDLVGVGLNVERTWQQLSATRQPFAFCKGFHDYIREDCGDSVATSRMRWRVWEDERTGSDIWITSVCNGTLGNRVGILGILRWYCYPG